MELEKLEKLKETREAKGFTQKSLSEELKIPLRTYQNYEQGLRGINIQTIKRIAQILECTLDELI